jgi:hypothetical protein
MNANDLFEEVWDKVVGGLDWLRQVIVGEFDENRSLSSMIADMLVSFAPGMIIVTSGRDLVAVIIRLAKHEEKREKPEEWMLLIACVIPLVLPLLLAAIGAAGAGVGAAIGGLVGDEAGAALRATCLLLIEKGETVLVELIGFLKRFVKGNVLNVLKDIRFTKYDREIVKYTGKFIDGLIGIIEKVRGEIVRLDYFHWLSEKMEKMADMERRFYAVQQSAVKAIPEALAELDARLQKVLSEALDHEKQLAHAGVPAPHPKPIVPEKTRVPAMPGNPLGTPEGTHPPGTAGRVEDEPNLHPEKPKEPKVKVAPEEKVPCFDPQTLPPSKLPELDRQLEGQQKGLNEMTAQEYLDGRKAFEDPNIDSRDPRIAKAARDDYRENLANELNDRYIDEGYSPSQAKQLAAAGAQEQMDTLAALHNPDLVAGGKDAISDFGDRDVNSTIGRQWKGGKKGVPTRVDQLDAAANSIPANERGTTRMNAKLERCK